MWQFAKLWSRNRPVGSNPAPSAKNKVKIVDNISNMVYIYILKNNNYKQQKFVKMKKILALITIVTLVSCGNQNSTEVKTEDTIMVADSTITLDSTSMVVDSVITESK
jgi:hypothetical protein